MNWSLNRYSWKIWDYFSGLRIWGLVKHELQINVNTDNRQYSYTELHFVSSYFYFVHMYMCVCMNVWKSVKDSVLRQCLKCLAATECQEWSDGEESLLFIQLFVSPVSHSSITPVSHNSSVTFKYSTLDGWLNQVRNGVKSAGKRHRIRLTNDSPTRAEKPAQVTGLVFKTKVCFKQMHAFAVNSLERNRCY